MQCPEIDQNELARTVTLAEGGEQSLSIAQVKEVMAKTFKALSKFRPGSVIKLVYAHADPKPPKPRKSEDCAA